MVMFVEMLCSFKLLAGVFLNTAPTIYVVLCVAVTHTRFPSRKLYNKNTISSLRTLQRHYCYFYYCYYKWGYLFNSASVVHYLLLQSLWRCIYIYILSPPPTAHNHFHTHTIFYSLPSFFISNVPKGSLVETFPSISQDDSTPKCIPSSFLI